MPITLMGPCTGHLGTISTFCPDYTNSEMTPFSNWLLMKSYNSQYGSIIKGTESSSGSGMVICISKSLALLLVLETVKMCFSFSHTWTLMMSFPSLKLCFLQCRPDSAAAWCICTETEKASSTLHIKGHDAPNILKAKKFISLSTPNHVA